MVPRTAWEVLNNHCAFAKISCTRKYSDHAIIFRGPNETIVVPDNMPCWCLPSDRSLSMVFASHDSRRKRQNQPARHRLLPFSPVEVFYVVKPGIRVVCNMKGGLAREGQLLMIYASQGQTLLQALLSDGRFEPWVNRCVLYMYEPDGNSVYVSLGEPVERCVGRTCYIERGTGLWAQPMLAPELEAMAQANPGQDEEEAEEGSLANAKGQPLCSICTTGVRASVTLPCMHCVCSMCFAKLYKDKGSCPFCRAGFPTWSVRVLGLCV